ncbi:MAG: hypothetical protein V4666_08360 [Bacteroidota bacterium]
MKIKIGKQQIEYLNELPTREMKIEFLLDHVLLMLEASLYKKTETVIFKDGMFTPEDQKLAQHLAVCASNNILYKEYADREIATALSILAKQKQKDTSKLERVEPIDSETLQKMKDVADPYGYDVVHHSRKNYTIGEIVDKVTELYVDKIEKENLLKFDLPKKRKFEECDIIKPPILTWRPFESLSKELLKNITTPYGLSRKRESCSQEFFEEVEIMKSYFDSNLLKEFVEYQPPNPDDVKRYSKKDLEKCFIESRRYKIEPPNPRDKFWISFEEYLKTISLSK